jgi:chaperonin cofactor prefoldin
MSHDYNGIDLEKTLILQGISESFKLPDIIPSNIAKLPKDSSQAITSKDFDAFNPYNAAAVASGAVVPIGYIFNFEILGGRYFSYFLPPNSVSYDNAAKIKIAFEKTCTFINSNKIPSINTLMKSINNSYAKISKNLYDSQHTVDTEYTAYFNNLNSEIDKIYQETNEIKNELTNIKNASTSLNTAPISSSVINNGNPGVNNANYDEQFNKVNTNLNAIGEILNNVNKKIEKMRNK